MKPLLLFIDDDANDTDLACSQLERAGIEVDCVRVASEQELRTAIASRMPKVILSDMVLPGWGCWPVLVVCHEIAPGVPFILYSGAVSVSDTLLAEDAGVFGWAEKDRPADLIAVVRLALEIQ